MNGVGLIAVGMLLGHRKRATTAIYAHLHDAALRDAATQAATGIARAMGYNAEPLPLPDVTEEGRMPPVNAQAASPSQRTPLWLRSGDERPDPMPPKRNSEVQPGNPIAERPRGDSDSSVPSAKTDGSSEPRRSRAVLWLGLENPFRPASS